MARSQRVLTDEAEAEVARLYIEEGVSYSALAEKFGCSTFVVKKALKRNGVTPRRRGNTLRAWSEDEIADMGKRWEAGQSQTAIAQAHNTSQISVSRVLAKHGIVVEHRRPKGTAHASWKGGRTVNGYGYVLVRVDPDEPLACMRNSTGYVPEHRLVMARMLGRPLGSRETVHHINGDKADNRPENLQLRHGKHGKGVTARCAVCGSHDIEFSDL